MAFVDGVDTADAVVSVESAVSAGLGADAAQVAAASGAVAVEEAVAALDILMNRSGNPAFTSQQFSANP